MSADIIVDDDYVTQVGGYCSGSGKELEEFFDEYLTTLGEIASQGIKGGAVHEAAVEFSAAAKKLKGLFESISQTGDEMCKSFVTQINEDDQFLY